MTTIQTKKGAICMILQATVTKYIPTNAYIYADNETKHGFLIDPGAQAGKLLELIREKGLTIEAILLTHGHFDHIGAVSELQETLKIPVYMGQKGRLYAENPVWNLSAQTDEPIVLSGVTYLEDHAIIALKEKPAFQLELLELPGHTADGVIYYTNTPRRTKLLSSATLSFRAATAAPTCMAAMNRPF